MNPGQKATLAAFKVAISREIVRPKPGSE